MDGGYNQIQSWPTPKLWEGRKLGTRIVFDATAANLFLSSLSIPTRKAQNQTDSANAGIGLTDLTIIIPTPVNRSVADDSNGNLTLTSLLVPVALIQSQTESANGDLQLTSLVVPTPDNRSVADDCNGALALTALTI